MLFDDLYVKMIAEERRRFFDQFLQKIDAHGQIRRLENGDLFRALLDQRQILFRIARRAEHGRAVCPLRISEHVFQIRRAGKIDHRVRVRRVRKSVVYGHAAQFSRFQVYAAHAFAFRVRLAKFEHVSAHVSQNTAD